jgi:UDP-N-acetylglucosamine 2-epimerase (non-hydrolysing)
MKKKLIFIFGTRPEAIKLAPLIMAFKKENDSFDVRICVTAQHRELLDQVLAFFNITPDFDLDIMKSNQSLFDITAGCLKGLEKVLLDAKPNLIFVQGDTTTALVGALAGFYHRISVAHIEAGLRSYEKYSPFPEEINRAIVSRMADLHFAPTALAVKNLIKEGINERVWQVGNTVIDALFLGLDIVRRNDEEKMVRDFSGINLSKRLILITGHRRESFGKPFENLCEAFKQIAGSHSDIEMIYPVHLNPNVREPVYRILKGARNVHLIEPLDYPHLIWIM